MSIDGLVFGKKSSALIGHRATSHYGRQACAVLRDAKS